MQPIEDEGATILLTWSDELTDFFRSRRLYLRYPWQLDGVYAKGSKLRIHKSAVAEPFSNHPGGRIVTMGAFSYCRTPNIAADFRVGRYCSVARDVQLSEQEHPLDRVSTHPFTTHRHMQTLAHEEFGRAIKITPHVMLGPAPVIGHDVWIGSGALIKRGITIGDGAVIAARAIVTKDVPPYAVVGGSPARVLKFRFPEHERELLLASAWWKYNYADFPAIDLTDVPLFVRRLGELVERGEIVPFEPKPVKIAEEILAEFAS